MGVKEHRGLLVDESRGKDTGVVEGKMGPSRVTSSDLVLVGHEGDWSRSDKI